MSSLNNYFTYTFLSVVLLSTMALAAVECYPKVSCNRFGCWTSCLWIGSPDPPQEIEVVAQEAQGEANGVKLMQMSIMAKKQRLRKTATVSIHEFGQCLPTNEQPTPTVTITRRVK